jgi:hypothetical protein
LRWCCSRALLVERRHPYPTHPRPSPTHPQSAAPSLLFSALPSLPQPNAQSSACSCHTPHSLAQPVRQRHISCLRRGGGVSAPHNSRGWV